MARSYQALDIDSGILPIDTARRLLHLVTKLKFSKSIYFFPLKVSGAERVPRRLTDG